MSDVSFGSTGHTLGLRLVARCLEAQSSGLWLATGQRLKDLWRPEERAAAAICLLRSMRARDLRLILGFVEECFQSAGPPLPTLLEPLPDARFWAALATSRELEAYCLAAFEALPRGRQCDFLSFANGRILA